MVGSAFSSGQIPLPRSRSRRYIDSFILLFCLADICLVDGQKRLVTYKEWSDLIQSSFEFNYYVPLDSSEDASYNINPAVINKRGIYKDVVGSGPGREWSDYQLRCNFPIAMVVAPELFEVKHARQALSIADKALRAPLGMKTLDSADMQYRGNYDNSNDSDDASIAKGLNYHQVRSSRCLTVLL
jgi:glycogen debranching enzyme